MSGRYTLVGSKYFLTLDLASGYWQVEVAENDQPKTAFTAPEGLFQFQVMPFGLCNALATFQWLMDQVLSCLKWSTCLVYFDNIMVVGTSFADHLFLQGSWGRTEAETRKVPSDSLPETCCLSWTYCVSRGNHHQPKQNGRSCKMAHPTIQTRSAAISRTRELL